MKRGDGWANILSGRNVVGADSRTASVFAGGRPLRREELDEMYRHGGILARIVDELPNLITRDPWSIAGDTDGELFRYLDGRGAQKALRKGMRWARLHGGAIIVIGINDGGSLESPVAPDRVRGLEYFRVYDRHQIEERDADIDRNARSARYGEREFYSVNPIAGARSQRFRAHWSRVIELDGRDVTDRARIQNQGWGDSYLQRIHEEVRRFTDAMDDGEIVLRDFVQGVLTIKGLTSLLATPAGEQLVKDRLNILDLSRHVLNTMLIDEGESYTKQISSVSGIADLLDRFMAGVASVAEMPQSILFGRAPAGLNATGDADIRAWYDSAASFQRETMAPIVLRLATLVLKVKVNGPKVQKLPEPLTAKFAPLWQLSAMDQATRRKTVAEADGAYIDRGVLSPEEVALSRFGGDEYSAETRLLDDRTAPQPVDDPEEPDPEDPAPGGKPPKPPKKKGAI